MTSHAYYSVAACPPPAGVVVVVVWDGRAPFEAARTRDPATGAACWLTHDKGQPVLLPYTGRVKDTNRPWAGWHTLRGRNPELWRPTHPDKWQLPLPDPAWIDPGEPAPARMWSASQRFSAVELAHEMERDREAARAEGAEADEPPERQWWLDPHAVTYAPRGRVTMRAAEGRLMRAFAAEWWVRVEWPRLKTSAQVLDNMAKSLPLPPGEAAAQDPVIARPEPTGRDQDDMLEALGWLRALPRSRARQPARGALQAKPSREESVLRLRAGSPARTWRRIGADIGRSGEAARGLYQHALAMVTEAANGGPTAETRAVLDQREAERVRLSGLRRRGDLDSSVEQQTEAL